MVQGPTSSPPLEPRNKYQGTFVPCHLYPSKEEDRTPRKAALPNPPPLFLTETQPMWNSEDLISTQGGQATQLPGTGEFTAK